ncbi:MAG TPA: ABA4-like family protein [Gemmatimonadales bacterium]|nr:ABA4-like family protein [Gemmatimonadales bacterium]
MTWETAFRLVNLAVVPVWLLMMLQPRWSITRTMVRWAPVPMVLTGLYTLLVAGHLDHTPGSYNSLLEVRQMLFHKPVLLAAWTHFLAVDLLLGGWMFEEAQRLHIPHVQLALCLFLTFLLGPTGAGIFLLLRLRHRKASAESARFGLGVGHGDG